MTDTVKRFALIQEYLAIEVVRHPAGDWVRHEDYAALAAERDALKVQLAEARGALQRITWALLNSDAGGMEATAFGYAERALKAIDNPKGNADE